MLLHSQGKKLFEMIGFGITLTGLPLTNGVSGGTEQGSQSHLSQSGRQS